MIETDTLLVNCPLCGAWLMAANPAKPNSILPELRLRCAKCGHQENGRRPRAAATQRVPQHRARARNAA